MQYMPEEGGEGWRTPGHPVMRVNTVRVDFRPLRRDMCSYELDEFIACSLNLVPDDVERLQWNRLERCLFLKMRDRFKAEQLIGLHNGRHRLPNGFYSSPIFLSLEDGLTDVLVTDLSELISNEQLGCCMSQFGPIVGIAEQLWVSHRFRGLLNGERTVRMVIRKPIPPVIQIGGERSTVVYEGMQMPAQPGWLIRGAIWLENMFRCVHDWFWGVWR